MASGSLVSAAVYQGLGSTMLQNQSCSYTTSRRTPHARLATRYRPLYVQSIQSHDHRRAHNEEGEPDQRHGESLSSGSGAWVQES
jgi:hypothetical protein